MLFFSSPSSLVPPVVIPSCCCRLFRISATAASTCAARLEARCSFREAPRTLALSAAAASSAGDSVPGMEAASSHAASSVYGRKRRRSFNGVRKKDLKKKTKIPLSLFLSSVSIFSPSPSLPYLASSRRGPPGRSTERRRPRRRPRRGRRGTLFLGLVLEAERERRGVLGVEVFFFED